MNLESIWVSFYYESESVSNPAMSDSLQPHGLYTRLLCPWNSPGKNTGVGCHSLLQGIFPTQGLNLGLLHCRQFLYGWATREDANFYYILTHICTYSILIRCISALEYLYLKGTRKGIQIPKKKDFGFPRPTFASLLK